MTQTDLDEALALEEDLALSAARRGLLGFTCYTKPDYQVNWHHKLISRYLNRVARGDLKRLIICMPPRCGKSELVSTRMPAYLFGVNPKTQIIAASYNATLAAKMNRTVQRVIDSPEYRKIFPGTQLNGANVRTTAQNNWLRNSDEFEIVGHGGFYRSAGVGGSATGYGMTCMTAGTMISTEAGQWPIERFWEEQHWPKVWAYDSESQTKRLCRVKAVQKKPVTELAAVRLSDGRQITCTPEHLFLTRNAGYIAAQDLASTRIQNVTSANIDQVLSLQNGGGEASVNAGGANCQRHSKDVLWQSVLRRCAKNREDRDKAATLRTVSKEVQAGKQLYTLLLTRMLRQDAFGEDEGRVESQLQAREAGGVFCKAQSTTVSAEKACASAGRVSLCCLQQKHGRPSGRARAPYRRGQKQQHVTQSDNPLWLLSYSGAQEGHIRCRSVDVFGCSPVDVFDIQVEHCGNFYANGIVVKNCGIIDDPVKNRDEANSRTYQERNWDWYTSTFYSRLEKNGAIIICATRWSQGDLIGRLLDQAKADPEADQWTVLNFPALCETGKHPDDPRELDEPLWPEKYNKARMLRMKAAIGSRDWASLYQQRPTPQGGGVVKEAWWRYYERLPADLTDWTLSVDLTFENKGDFACYQVWAAKGADRYLVDMAMRRETFTEQLQSFVQMCEKHPKVKVKLVENAANGAALINTLKSKIPGIIAVKPQGSKENRAEAVAPQIEAGNVYLPAPSIAPWASEFVAQWSYFPNGAHDDAVDACSQALARMAKSRFDLTAGLPVALGDRAHLPDAVTRRRPGHRPSF